MWQVLFRIPIKAPWLPDWLPVSLFLVLVGLGVGGALWLLARRADRLGIAPDSLRNLAVGVAVLGAIAGGLVYKFGSELTDGVPIYGFGMMLFFAFLSCTWLAGRRGEREGISKETIQDLAIWVFVGGLLGARIAHLLDLGMKPWKDSEALWDFISQLPRIWDGGIILYGSVVGAAISYTLGYFLVFRKRHLNTLRLLDVVAPAITLGLCLGRIGCFLNGCCFGQVACTSCALMMAPAHFPMSSPPRESLVEQGYQTPAGFTVQDIHQKAVVAEVNPESRAYAEGLRRGAEILAVNEWRITPDHIDEVNGRPLKSIPVFAITDRVLVSLRRENVPNTVLDRLRPLRDYQLEKTAFEEALRKALGEDELERYEAAILAESHLTGRLALNRQFHLNHWKRGKAEVTLSYRASENAEPETITLSPRTLGLYPTQIYEVISMALLMLVLLAYEPFRRNPGQVAAVLLVGYGLHRSLNEILRDDPRPLGFERYGSVVCIVTGVLLWVFLQWFWKREPAATPVAVTSVTATPIAPTPATAVEKQAVKPGP
jgi:prolipoprotein diacylglyceryltransferase